MTPEFNHKKKEEFRIDDFTCPKWLGDQQGKLERRHLEEQERRHQEEHER